MDPQQVYFLFSRSFLHLFTSASIFFLIKSYTPISKTAFLFIILPLAIFLEYCQYISQAADNVSRIVLLRDTLEILLIVATFILLYIFKKTLPENFLVFSMAIILILLLMVSIFVENYKPAGKHLLYKSFIDVVAYGLGPFIIYPIIVKLLKLP